MITEMKEHTITKGFMPHKEVAPALRELLVEELPPYARYMSKGTLYLFDIDNTVELIANADEYAQNALVDIFQSGWLGCYSLGKTKKAEDWRTLIRMVGHGDPAKPLITKMLRSVARTMSTNEWMVSANKGKEHLKFTAPEQRNRSRKQEPAAPFTYDPELAEEITNILSMD